MPGLRSEQMGISKRGMEDREAGVHPKVIPLGDGHLWTGKSHIHHGDFQSPFLPLISSLSFQQKAFTSKWMSEHTHVHFKKQDVALGD